MPLLPKDGRPVATLEDYKKGGGFDGLNKALSMAADEIVDAVTRAGLRGRGGGGFPTGTKWAGVRKAPGSTKYICCNAAEGEPGTFKDRWLLRKNPYLMLEGLLIGRHALGAKTAYIGIKEKFRPEIARLEKALDEITMAGIAKKGEIKIVKGPYDYLFGEEKALLEVIEGNRPMPRVLAPHIEGLFRKPNKPNATAVNNVETLGHVAQILRDGAAAFKSVGAGGCPGTMIFTLLGDVKRPGIYELPMGTPFRRLLEECGEGKSGKSAIRAVFSGVANPVLVPEAFDTPLDFDSMKKAGTGLGSGGFIVYDGTACLVRVASIYSGFLAKESCGQCEPCKRGCDTITGHLVRMESGQGSEEDLKEIRIQCGKVEDGRRCFLAAEENLLISSLLDRFAPEFQNHFSAPCKNSRPIPLPLITDFDEKKNVFVF